MKRYKYLVQHNITNNDLNHFGALGWELVSVIYISSKTESKEKYIFKKET